MHYNFSTLFTYAITVLSHLHSFTFIQLSLIFAFVKLFLSGTNAGCESCKNLTSGGACPHCTKISSRHSAETRVQHTFSFCRLMNWFHWFIIFAKISQIDNFWINNHPLSYSIVINHPHDLLSNHILPYIFHFETHKYFKLNNQINK